MRPRALRSGAALLAILASLAACRTVPPPLPGVALWDTRKTQLQAWTHFELKGRVAVAAGSDGFNADLHWIQDGERSQVTLQGPLGVGAAEITVTGEQLVLVTSRGEHIDSDAAHTALAQRLGFDPPLASLRYWILGVPDPGQPSTEELDASQQRLSALTQGGWHVTYASYVAAGDGALPARLTVLRNDVRLRVLVDDWQP
jgi:outer membrane lipoprotein LolB